MRSSGADDGLLWCVQRQPKDIQDDDEYSSRNSKEEGEKLYSKIMCARMRTTTSAYPGMGPADSSCHVLTTAEEGTRTQSVVCLLCAL